jgi:hypothetical protein
MPDMTLLDLYRENHVGVDRNIPVYLWIDNVPRGSVLPCDTLQTELEPGPHRLEVKADDAKAKPLVVDVEPGAPIHLVLTSRPGWGLMNSFGFGSAVRMRLTRTD